MVNKKSDTFSTAAIANVSGKSRNVIRNRATSLGIDTKSGYYTAEQAYSLIYYTRKKRIVGRETLAQETNRLIKALEKYNSKIGQKTVIAA